LLNTSIRLNVLPQRQPTADDSHGLVRPSKGLWTTLVASINHDRKRFARIRSTPQ